MKKTPTTRFAAIFAVFPLVSCSSSSPAAAVVDPCAGIDLSSDSGNCGACGHDCQGGDCSAGLCQPVVLATNQNSPRTVVVDSTNVYAANEPTGEGDTAGFITLAPIAGGAAKKSVVGLGFPESIAITSTYMFIGDDDLLRVPLAGGTPTPLGTGASSVGNVTVDASNVYFVFYGSQSVGPNAEIKAMPLAGGAAQFLGGGSHESITDIAVDSSNVYYLVQDANTWSVWSAPLGGGAETKIASQQAQPHSIVSDGTSVYWTNMGPTGNIMTAPAAGGAATVLATAASGGGPAGIAIDAQNIYYADYDLGTINRVPRDGSPATVLVTGLNAPEPIAVDATTIYFATNDGDKIGKLQKVAK